MSDLPPPVISSRADNEVPRDIERRLAAVLHRTAGRRGVHHALLAVASGDGRQHWHGAVGPAAPDGPDLQPDSPFFIASVTKRFIVTLALQAHERGEVALDARLVDLLPASLTDRLHVLKGVDHTADITLRHLLSHTAGLPDYLDRPRRGGTNLYADILAGRDRAWGPDEVVRLARDEHRPHFPPQDLTAPRQAARYSDTGFQLVLAVLTQATGRSFPDLLRDRIFEPVGLPRTWQAGRSEPLTPVAGPVAAITHRRTVLHVPQALTSSNDLTSTTADLLRFQQALLAGEPFSRPETVQLLTERANRLRNLPSIRYGLGTMIFRVPRIQGPGRRAVTLIGHSGSTGTWLFHCPELDLHLAGTTDQAARPGLPFRVMADTLAAWHG